jgi:ribosomal protein L7/L12
MSADSSTVGISPELVVELQKLVQSQQRIAAVKKVRLVTGCSLTDAVRTVDQLAGNQLTSPSDEQEKLVLKLLLEDKVVEAVKLYRTQHGTDLRTSKLAIDRLRSELGVSVAPTDSQALMLVGGIILVFALAIGLAVLVSQL